MIYRAARMLFATILWTMVPLVALSARGSLEGPALRLASSEFNEEVRVSLDAFPLYARPGFSQVYTRPDLAIDEGSWQRMEGDESGRSISLLDIDYPGKPPHHRFDFSKPDYREFTFLIPFELDVLNWAALRRSTKHIPIPAFYFAGIGDNWELWLNGKIIRRELYLDDAGSITLHRTIKKIVVPFDTDLLNLGRNTLVIRVIGDIKYPTTGLFLKGPHYLGTNEVIRHREEPLLQLVFIGLYIFVGLYHLFLYSRRLQDRHNLYYGLFSMTLGLYLYTRTGVFFLMDSHLVSRIELVSLYAVLPLVGSFIEHLNRGRVSLVTKVYSVISLLFMVAACAFTMNVAHYTLRLWQLTALVMALFYWVVRVLYEYIKTTISECRKKDDASRLPFVVLLGIRLFTSSQGNLVVGSSLLLATGIYDILNSMFWNYSQVITPYGFLLFTLGTALVLANRFTFLYARVSELNNTLDERIEEIQSTTERLAASEHKYRSLFESTSEPVALLDQNLRFVEGNRAAVEFFSLDRPANEGLRLQDALFCDEREANRPVRTLELAAASLTERHPSREDTFRFRTALGEARSCLLRLERIKSGSGAELLMRLSPDPESLLTKAFVEGRETWQIESSLSAADEACRHIGEHLKRYQKEDEANFLMVCLREMVINAVEHGNLEVSWDEKTRAQQEGRYFDFLRERQAQPKYRKRRVLIEYSIGREKATFRISDEGKGFDHRAFLKAGIEATPELLEHGRGLFMTLNAFDRVVYNERGNQVTLLKKLS